MPKLLVAGGRQPPNSMELNAWQRSEAGVLLLVDTDKNDVTKLMEYQTPPGLTAETEKVSTTFKVGEVVGDSLFLPTEWEILDIDLHRSEIRRKWSLPCFNDVHAVTLRGKNLVVTSTGLDAVFEVSEDGIVINEWSVLCDEDIWSRFDKNEDYRKVPSTKPHLSHPNFSAVIDGEIWVTRFQQKDSVCLTSPAKRPLVIGIERPHDGLKVDGVRYFTTVNGFVVAFDAITGERIADFDLNEMKWDVRPLGWCRGFAHVAGISYIGFSRLRPTRFMSNLSWITDAKRNLSSSVSRPTRISAYDLNDKTHHYDINLEEFGLDVLFSILPL